MSNREWENSATDETENSSGNGWVKTLSVNTDDTYYLMVSKWSKAGSDLHYPGIYGWGSLDCDVLPVTLTSFTCK
jgi:hypothetical protein